MAPQINEMGSKSRNKESLGDPFGGGVQGGGQREGNQKLYIVDAHWIAFGAFSVPVMPKWVFFWAPLDFDGVPKWNSFI